MSTWDKDAGGWSCIPRRCRYRCGGDIDARWEDADGSGEESVAGSAPTPGQDNVQEMGEALGITYQDNEELKAGEKERSRDKHRWELDPASSEDYQDRAREEK